ncbi:MAG: hypothetical protein ACRC18_06460 [Cetobacterium sp.]
MDIKDIINDITNDDVIKVLEHLGAELSSRSNDDQLIFSSVCHESESYKLYYYTESKSFYCYSNCHDIGDIVALLSQVRGYSNGDGISELKQILGISGGRRKGFHRHKKIKKKSIKDIELEKLPTPDKPFIYSTFKQVRIKEWEDEYITFKSIKQFDIRYNEYNSTIVIPHFDWNDNKRVVGIRVRNTIDELIELYGKYCPMYDEDRSYAHSLGKNLYGLNISIDNIKKHKKIIIGEGEKFCLQYNSMFSVNISVSTCGCNLTKYHKRILLELGVEEVLICFDKQYQDDIQLEHWKNKIYKSCKDLIECGVRVYSIYDDIEGLLEYKDSPLDKGDKVFKKLIKNKTRIGEGNEI